MAAECSEIILAFYMPKAERLCIAAIQGQNKWEATGSREEEEGINKEGEKDDE